MKKIAFIMTLLALCCGCSDTTDEQMSVPCEESYRTEFAVVNKTDRQIIILSTLFGKTFAIAPRKSRIIEEESMIAACNNTELRPDIFKDGEYPFFAYGDRIDGAVGYWFTMTVDGQDVPVEIWRRKHWSFTSGYHSRTYTLTVTDKLLGEILK